MATRREIIKTSAAALAVTATICRTPVLAEPARTHKSVFDMLILDERIAGSEALSSLAWSYSIPGFSIRGDLPRLWFESLRERFVARASTVAGLSSDLDSEVMRAFARDVGYGQKLRVDVSIDPYSEPVTVLREANRALSEDPGTTEGLGNLLAQIDALVRTRDQHARLHLVAWVIAPVCG